MVFTKLVNQLLLGSVAFSISFILGLLVHRDSYKAFLTGGVTVTACYAAATVTNRRRTHQEQQDRDSLSSQIQSLEKKETQISQSLTSATALQQELEASIKALQTERTQLLHRITELHCQRNSLYKNVSTLQKQRQQQERIYQVQQLKLQHLERRKDQISQSLYVQITQIKPTQKHLQTLQREFEQIQKQILERQELHQQIDFSLVTLESQKRYLEIEVANLHGQLDDLASLYEQLSYSILSSRTKKQKLEESLIDQEEQLQNQKQLAEVESLAYLRQSNHSQLPKEWLAWLNFYRQLSDNDKLVLKSILNQDETSLKQMAAQKATTTEVLVDSVNKHAINVFGTAIFDRYSNSTIPNIHEEYSRILLEPTLVSLKDLFNS